MANVDSFSDLAAVDMAGTDYFYVFRSGGQKPEDRRFSFSSVMRSLFLAANQAQARASIGFLTATALLDFASIAAQAKADLTISVPGAKVGDAVFLGLPAAPAAGLVFNAFVSADDVVTVRASNTSGGAVDATSATYRALVIKSS